MCEFQKCGEKFMKPPSFAPTCRDVWLAPFQWCVLVLKRTTPGWKFQVPDLCGVPHRHRPEVTGWLQRVQYRKYRTVSNTHYRFHSWVSTQRLKDPWWRDRDDGVTLYLHIYETALFCSLIWLIAGKNWERWGLLRQNKNIYIKYFTIPYFKPGPCHH